jgi:hypothetical protein
MGLEAVGIGDLHLTDSYGHGGLASYIENPDLYVMREVTRILVWARKQNIKHVFMYGDVCCKPRMSYEAHLALTQMLRKHKKFEFHFILGNHDKAGLDSQQGHSLELLADYQLPNVHIYTSDTIVNIEGVDVNFLSWPSSRVSKKALNVIHVEVNGSQLDSGKLIESEELSATNAVCVAGHLHTKHRVRNTYYSGTIYQTCFGEGEKKYFHHISFRNNEDYEINSVPFDHEYKLFNVVINTDDDMAKLSKNPKHLLKVVVKDGVKAPLPDLPNIVISKAYKTKAELQTILTEDLVSSTELVIKSDDFFNHWLANKGVPEKLQVRTTKLRKDILNGSK